MLRRYLDIGLLKILVLFYTLVSLISFGKIIYFKVNQFAYFDESWSSLFFESIVLDWIIIIFFMTLIAITTKWMITKSIKWPIIIFIHLFFSFFFSIAIYFMSSVIYVLSGQIELSEIDLPAHMAGIVSVIDVNFLIYFSMISIVYSFYYFQKTQQVELEKSKLTNQLTNVKLNVLKYKLHPHFLFNTLNSISSLIEVDTKLAQDTVANFGDLLRELLDMKDTSLIPLHQEINISKRYLDIMSLRFSEDLEISINVEKEMNHVLVPSLILLPIIENSIKHGYSYYNTRMKIDLTIKTQKDKVAIIISNDGAPLKVRTKYGNGLQNTIDRLDILYRSNYKFSMKNLKFKKGVQTTIIIPNK